MTKLQTGAIASAFALLMIMYFGCDTKPKEHLEVEKQRGMMAESTGLQSLLKEARSGLANQEASAILALETRLEKASTEDAKIDALKALSKKWFELNRLGISGSYAQEIAEKLQTEDAWSIAGTTYTICVQRSQEEKIRSFCTDNAVQAYENAISINSENLQHRVNLALLYTENPPKENPMQGILMLVEMNKQHPENVSVLNNLGRLGIQTGQFEKAIKRLEKAISVEPENSKTICLLAKAYKGFGNQEKATQFQQLCTELSN